MLQLYETEMIIDVTRCLCRTKVNLEMFPTLRLKAWNMSEYKRQWAYFYWKRMPETYRARFIQVCKWKFFS